MEKVERCSPRPGQYSIVYNLKSNMAYEILMDMRGVQRQINAKILLDTLRWATSLDNQGYI